MAKKKSRKRVLKIVVDRVAVSFDCPFCSFKKAVEVKVDKKKDIATVSCRVCSSKYETKTNHLTAPIDIYSEWLDDCEKENRKVE